MLCNQVKSTFSKQMHLSFYFIPSDSRIYSYALYLCAYPLSKNRNGKQPLVINLAPFSSDLHNIISVSFTIWKYFFYSIHEYIHRTNFFRCFIIEHHFYLCSTTKYTSRCLYRSIFFIISDSSNK